MQQLKKEQDKMEQEGIIRASSETTEWVHNLVTVVKKDGALRLCHAQRNLNKYLIRSIHYPALAGIPGKFSCADDVKVQGSTEEHHDIHLLETVDKARQAGLQSTIHTRILPAISGQKISTFLLPTYWPSN